MQTVLAKVVLRESASLTEAEVAFRNCPQDNFANHVSQIVSNIKDGKTKLFEIVKDGSKCGFVAVEIFNGEFVVVAMHAFQPCNVFQTILPLFEDWAKNNGCRCITFSTVRPGLITSAIQNGFQMSEVVLRKHFVK